MIVMEIVLRTVAMGNPLGARLTETVKYARSQACGLRERDQGQHHHSKINRGNQNSFFPIAPADEF